MKRITLACCIALLAAGVGCVIRTEHRIDAHVTLDIRHIREQAGPVLDYMEGKTDQMPELAPVTATGSTSMLDRAWAALRPFPVAYAAEDLKTDSARIRQILKSIHERAPRVTELKKQGCAGETNRGYLALRDCAAVADAAAKNEVQKVIAEENADRKAFYQELARLNSANPNVTVAYVERVYAFERLQRAASGEVYQLPPTTGDAPADLSFEAFQKLPLCGRLGADCQPNAWVTVP
jgi:uncharacterized protein YdbL (DUF1318 family)